MDSYAPIQSKNNRTRPLLVTSCSQILLKCTWPNASTYSAEMQAEDSDQGDSVKRSNVSRESGMPKRPHNAFFYYSQDKRPK